MRRRREDENGTQEVVELAALADGTLAAERRAELEARVAASSELVELLAEQQRAVTLIRDAADEVEAPAALRARIEAQARGRRVETPRRLLVIAASATAVLTVAIGLSVFRTDRSPEQFRAVLAPTALVPDASGDATLTKTSSGWRIELDATELPRLENGRYYQAWLRNTAGVLVPIGTFNEGRKVTLWAGVRPTDFTTFSVTRERADGDQSSSGEKVLVGTIDTGDSG
jgi:anti-sigma-K factor RskA